MTKVYDRGSTFYTTEKIGPKQSMTREGFLICEEAPIARTGEMIYGPGECPIEVGADGVTRISRDDKEVFRPETIASFQGKPITDDHPTEDVTPENYKKYEVGTIINPRRGTGIFDDLLLADLVIKDPAAIKAIKEGKRELSCGYDCDYHMTSDERPGYGFQSNIIGNHVALVDTGRCGSRCRINDQAKGEDIMAKGAFARWLDSIRAAAKDSDPGKLEEVLKTDPPAQDEAEPATHIHIHGGGSSAAAPATTAPAGEKPVMDEATENRFKALEDGHKAMMDGMAKIHKHLGIDEKGELPAGEQPDKEIEGALREEAPPGTEESAAKAKDSAYLVDSFSDTVAGAEILVPGISVPTFDQAARPAKTVDAICRFRKTALELAYAKPETRVIIDEITGNRKIDFTKIACHDARSLFLAAVAAQKRHNGNVTTGSQHLRSAGRNGNGQVRSISDIQRLNATHYADK